ncbi:porin family protein [Parabacteroides provencensis]|uniref:porin family protein n=1 Tax=Parabacteroides provencensis TaxID=1944636 RepID=UPI000C148CAE|nr:porin family protein [Parabacteroides provencensis]
MKQKFIFSILLLLGSYTIAFAQFSFTPNVGICISDISNTRNSHDYISYNFGVGIDYHFNRWGIRSGLFLKEKGTYNMEGSVNIDEYPVNTDLITMDAKLMYMQLPVLASYRLPIYDHVAVQLNVGPYVAYGLKGKYNLQRMDREYGISSSPFDRIIFETESYGKKDLSSFTKWDWGINAGVEMSVYRFNIGVSYEIGLKGLSSHFPIRYDGKQRNRSWNMYVGFTI